jgi:tetratricopeptide (TPR) repeat protein
MDASLEDSMRRRTVAVAFVAVFALGVAVGVMARSKTPEPAMFLGQSKQDAARALLEIAREQAGRGSWERIAVGRAYYLGGLKKEGQGIFDSIRRPEDSDLLRIGRVYYEAGEWDKAKQTFDRVIDKAPKDAPKLAEIGAYYNLKGERDHAEELFVKSFALEASEAWNTTNIAGSYLGVEPQR